MAPGEDGRSFRTMRYRVLPEELALGDSGFKGESSWVNSSQAPAVRRSTKTT